MRANDSPYLLKDLHQSIDLIDRKIAYGMNLETFASQEARAIHLRKLSTRRAALVKSARALTDLGVRCDPQFLPRSFIHLVPGAASSAVPGPDVAAGTKLKKPARPRQKRS